MRAGVARIHGWLAELGLPEAELGAWELALIEAGNNAVKYVATTARQQPIIFEISAGARDVEARVIDRTAGFNWPTEIALPAAEAERGRGLYLMKSLTNELFYLRGDSQNVLVLRRARPAGAAVLPDAADLQRRVAEAETALTDMTAELATNYESLVAVFRYSSELGGHTDLKDFSRRLLRDLMQIAEADAAVLRLVSADGKKLETAWLLPERNAEGSPARLAAANLADTSAKFVEVRAARTRMDIWFSPEEPMDAGDPLRAAMPVGNGICHAFFVADQLVGTATLSRLAANRPFTAAQVNLLHTFVDFLAIQVVNARLLDERTAARVTRRELDIAAEIQRSLLPASLPDCPPFTLAAECRSATEVGGDFYDVIPAGPGAALLVIADVMGKGVAAALFATMLRSTIRSLRHLFVQPAELLSAVNRTLYDDLSRVHMFITLTALYLDAERGGMITASAGHCPILFSGPGSAGVTATPAGLPLGIEEDSPYRQVVNALPPGGAALLHTDGLNEARNERGEFLGEERLSRLFAAAVAETRTAKEAEYLLLRRLEEFRGGAPMADDQTLIVIRNSP